MFNPFCLSINSIAISGGQSVDDQAGNSMTDPSIPSGKNLADEIVDIFVDGGNIFYCVDRAITIDSYRRLLLTYNKLHHVHYYIKSITVSKVVHCVGSGLCNPTNYQTMSYIIRFPQKPLSTNLR